jgi:hypothetical protein
MMNRRQMVVLPGIALAATAAFAETRPAAIEAAKRTSGVSRKAIARYSRLKAFYKVPKTEAKQTKYIGFLTAVLGLTPAQQAQAKNTFFSAGTSLAAVKTSTKAARVVLSTAIKNNDTGAISSATSLIGTYAAQRHMIGAAANASFFQTLTASQQAEFNQLRG